MNDVELNSPRYVTCRCQHCDGHIEFDANALAEENVLVPCPHCNLETQILIPPQFLKSKCFKCSGGIEFSEDGVGQTVNCPHCGQKTKLGVNPFAKPLQEQTGIKLQFFKCDPPPIALPPTVLKQQMTRTPLAKLTEATISSRTKSGDTPLHRAAKNGKISEVPSHLLTTELFIEKNNRGETPLHFAAKHGYLARIPAEFLTKETLMALDYYGRTPLHFAASYGFAETIPIKFLTPEFLNTPTKNFTADTILHIVAERNEVSKIPSDCITPEMWNVKNGYGRTPRGNLEGKIRNDAWIASVRNEPATEKQKGKLLFFGCSWEEGITKGQASDALEECARKFPDIDRAYYNRPATDEQLAKLRSFGEDPIGDPDDPLTYGQAKDWISQCEIDDHDRVIREMDNG